MARGFKALVVERAARALADHRRIGHGNCAERSAHPQSGHDLRYVRYQALWQVAHLGARVGDDLLALAVIEFLRHRERLAGRPAEARSAQFLQRRQIVQLGRSLPLVLDTYAKRALETLSGVDDALGNLTLEDSLLRRMPHLELAAGNFRNGDNVNVGDWHEVPDLQLALADDRQSRRLHAANTDDPPRALTQDDGCSAGE